VNDVQVSADESHKDIHDKKPKKRKLVRVRPARIWRSANGTQPNFANRWTVNPANNLP